MKTFCAISNIVAFFVSGSYLEGKFFGVAFAALVLSLLNLIYCLGYWDDASVFQFIRIFLKKRSLESELRILELQKQIKAIKSN